MKTTKQNAAYKTAYDAAQAGGMNNTDSHEVASDAADFFGEVISSYSRKQAIADGVLVDVSNILTPCPFKYPVAMTRAAYDETIAAGGNWLTDDKGTVLHLPPGQDIKGRAHDLFWMLLDAIKRSPGATDRVDFAVLVDRNGDGRKTKVQLYSVCGPGDTADPVLTIMLPDED